MASNGVFTVLPEWAVVTRLLAALLLGGLIGLDREFKRRPAGLRTHMLVSLAAALFTIITIELHLDALSNAGSRNVTADPIRIIEAVTAGVAFIAAGTIIQSRGDVKGVTTGTAIWLAGAIGVACGIGYYFIAAATTVLALAVLFLLGWVETRWFGDSEDEKSQNARPTD